MLILGAKGLAKEILQLLENQDSKDDVFLFDDVNVEESSLLYNKYSILRTEHQVKQVFSKDNRFLLGLGNPHLRLMLYNKFINLGGILHGLKSKQTDIGNYVEIGEGVTLMSGVRISNGVKIGKALLAYYNVIITHDVEIGNFVELSPGCKLLGRVTIEDHVQVGAGVIILPDVKIEKGAIIGAGAVVTKDVKPGTIVIGNPAKELIRK